MKRTVNFKALLALLGGLAVAILTVHFVHGYQVTRSAATLLAEAQKAEEEGQAAGKEGKLSEQREKFGAAVKYYDEYLGLERTNAQAFARFGILQAILYEDKGSNREKSHTYQSLQQALVHEASLSPQEKEEVRRHLARTALRLLPPQFEVARKELLALRKPLDDKKPLNDENLQPDPELMKLLGTAQLGLNDRASARKSLKLARQWAPHDMEAYQLSVGHLLSTKDPKEAENDAKEADGVIAEMIDNNKESVPARLLALRYFYARHAWEKVEDEAGVIQKLSGKEPSEAEADALLMAAEAARQTPGAEEKYRKYLETGVSRYPQDARFLLALARLELRDGHADKADQRLQQALQHLPRDPALLAELAIFAEERGDKGPAEKVMVRLKELGAAWHLAYLEARQLMHQGAWAEARDKLEPLAAPSRLPSKDYAYQVNLLLADCYGRLGDHERQAIACQNALANQPGSLQAIRLLAASLAAAGDLPQAIVTLKKLPKDVRDKSPDLKLDLARLLLEENRRRSPAQQRWSEVEEELPPIPDKGEDKLGVWQVWAELRRAQGKPGEAWKLAETQRNLNKQQVAPWLFLAGLLETAKPDSTWAPGTDTLELLNDAEKEIPSRVEWDLLRVSHWTRKGRKEGLPELQKLEARVEKLPSEADRHRLLAALSDAYLALDEVAAAQRLLQQLAQAKSQEHNANLRFLLFELALQSGKLDEARRLREEITGIEGKEGPLSSYGAAALLVRTQPDNVEARSQARQILDKVALVRPNWSRVPLLQGQLAEREKSLSQAAEHYKKAVDLGENRVAILQHAAQLLFGAQRYAEGQAMMAKLPEQVRAAGNLGRLAAQAQLQEAAKKEGPDADEARRKGLKLATDAVAGSKDYHDAIWLGQMCALARQPGEAKKAYQNARDLDPTRAETWAALLLFLARQEPKEIDKAIAEAEHSKLAPDQLARVLLATYEALGDFPKADAEYKKLATDQQRDPLILEQLVGYGTRRGQTADVVKFLQRLLEPETKAPPETIVVARRNLAVQLAFAGGLKPFQQALALLAENVKANGGGEKAEDLQARAQVLATQAAHRSEAIALFEQLAAKQPAVMSSNSRLLLAQLYEAQNNLANAQSQLVGLLADDEKNPTYLVDYIRFLLRHDKATEAATWFERLDRLKLGTFETKELKARLLHAQGKTPAAIEVLLAYAAEKDARKDVAALVLDDLAVTEKLPEDMKKKCTDAAGQLFEQHAQAAQDPQAILLLARHLGMVQETARALDLCEGVWGKAPMAAAQIYVTVLRLGRPNAALDQRAQRRLQEALAKEPQPKGPEARMLMRLLAELYEARDHYDEAIVQYRRLLELDSRDVLALNNLAYLLAMQKGDPPAALELVKVALEEAGPQAELLDTEAVAYLKHGQADRAITDLQKAIAQAATPESARLKYLHLAQAYLLAKDVAKAREAFAKVGLKEEAIATLERPGFAAAAAQLKP
jgi:tetratricopeptide (TPR) repeat protein